MKAFLISFILIIKISYCLGQKPYIDSSAYGKWTELTGIPAISNDGNYIIYNIDYKNEVNSLIIQATNIGWHIEIFGVNPYSCVFINDSRKVVYTTSKDSLCIFTIKTASIESIPNINSYKVPENDKRNWLAYQLNNKEKELIVQNLNTNERLTYFNVNNYFFSNDGKILVMQFDKGGGDSVEMTNCVDLDNGHSTNIWQGDHITNLIFDDKSVQLAFVVGNENGNSFWCYNVRSKTTKLLANNQSIANDLKLDNIEGFTRDGERLLINLKLAKETILKTNPQLTSLDIWSYKDAKLQSKQLENRNFERKYKSIVNIQDQTVIRLEQKDEHIILSNKDIALICKVGDADSGEWDWNPALRRSYYLINTRDGKRKTLRENTNLIYVLSPEGKYSVYYNPVDKNFFCVDVKSGIARNITQRIHSVWTTYDNDQPIASYYSSALSCWLDNDSSLLLYDQNDIWKVDLDSNKDPVNLTNGYGRANNIVFRIVKDENDMLEKFNSPILLSAFNRSTKENGFYVMKPNKLGSPEKLTMGSYVYYIPEATADDAIGDLPIKAQDSGIFLVKRMSATESPNYFCTKDFKKFTQLSFINPERKYNWLNTTLISWKTLDGKISQGILYKPENFDPKKKYPVIFHYYNKKSHLLNKYIKPEAANGDINIPYFVSNDYLVFTPDIHFKVGETGESVVNTMVSAANYLSKFSWVNSQKMGIQGFSFGGYSTNYLVTHTHLFAAAMSGAGPTDLISFYGGTFQGGSSRQGMVVWSGLGMGGHLSKMPNRYIKNSPIFNVNKVTTPLLMMSNKKDGAVDFAQALELFTSLRQLGKKVWLLQYDDGEHGVSGRVAEDYTIRVTQFFNHYLKDQLPPKWMTIGIPALRKGIESGFELDSTGVIP